MPESRAPQELFEKVAPASCADLARSPNVNPPMSNVPEFWKILVPKTCASGAKPWPNRYPFPSRVPTEALPMIMPALIWPWPSTLSPRGSEVALKMPAMRPMMSGWAVPGLLDASPWSRPSS